MRTPNANRLAVLLEQAENRAIAECRNTTAEDERTRGRIVTARLLAHMREIHRNHAAEAPEMCAAAMRRLMDYAFSRTFFMYGVADALAASTAPPPMSPEEAEEAEACRRLIEHNDRVLVKHQAARRMLAHA